jgi:ankyrin repeat protein
MKLLIMYARMAFGRVAGGVINAPNAEGDTPLHFASMYGNEEVVRDLLESGADPAAQNDIERTALHNVARGKTSIVRMLLEKAENPFELVNQGGGYTPKRRPGVAPVVYKGRTPLMMAAFSGDDAVVHELLRSLAMTDLEDDDGNFALQLACSGQNLLVVNALLAANADVNKASANSQNVPTPLIAAIFRGRGDIVDALLAVPEIDVNKTGFRGETPLIVACGMPRQQTFEIVQELLLKNANVTKATDEGKTPLQTLCSVGLRLADHAEIAKMLFARGAGDAENLFSLLVSSLKSRGPSESTKEFTRVLIERGAGVNAIEDGETPLTMAARHQNFGAISALLDANADVNKPNQLGETPVIVACKLRGLSLGLGILEELLARGARLDVADSMGMTPLMIASEKANFDMVKLIVETLETTYGPEKLKVELVRGYSETFSKTATNFALVGDPSLAKVKIAKFLLDETIIDEADDAELFDYYYLDNYQYALELACGLEPGSEREDLILSFTDYEPGYFALTVLAENRPDVAELKHLVDNAANVDATDEDGDTALHILATSRSTTVEMVKALIDAGARTRAFVNEDGKRASDIAVETGLGIGILRLLQ